MAPPEDFTTNMLRIDLRDFGWCPKSALISAMFDHLCAHIVQGWQYLSVEFFFGWIATVITGACRNIL